MTRTQRVWIQHFTVNLLRDRKGQDFIEYALLAGLAAVCALSCFPAAMATGSYLGDAMQAILAAIVRISG